MGHEKRLIRIRKRKRRGRSCKFLKISEEKGRATYLLGFLILIQSIKIISHLMYLKKQSSDVF